MTFDEIFKTGLVFSHFFASAVALVTIVRADFLILMQFNSRLSAKACERIHGVKDVVRTALAVLWLTGVAICAHGYMHDPAYILNQKLWMKVIVVLILSLNGWLLHRFAFRFIQPGARLCEASPAHRAVFTLLACVSSTSWVFACFFGIARALNNKQNFGDLLSVYALALVGATICGLWVTNLMASWHARGVGIPSGVLSFFGFDAEMGAPE